LAYYLIGSVLLDYNATKLHKMTARGQNMIIGEASNIPEAVRREVRARRHLYWMMLGRYLLIHVWSLALAASLLWIFDSTTQGSSSTILFLSYVAAYTGKWFFFSHSFSHLTLKIGLLWFQYTKIFSGPRTLKPLLVAVAVGIPLGQFMRRRYPQWNYCDVVPLGAASWTAAILSLYYARIRTKPLNGSLESPSLDHSYSKLDAAAWYHSHAIPGKDPFLSQDELKIMYGNLRVLREDERYQIDPLTHPGLEIKTVLENAMEDCRGMGSPCKSFALRAFPGALELLHSAVTAFENGSAVIECISMSAMTMPDVKAITYAGNSQLRIIMGCQMVDISDKQSSIEMFCRTAAEILLHAVAETFVGINHNDSTLAESLLSLAPSRRYVYHKSKYISLFSICLGSSGYVY